MDETFYMSEIDQYGPIYQNYSLFIGSEGYHSKCSYSPQCCFYSQDEVCSSLNELDAAINAYEFEPAGQQATLRTSDYNPSKTCSTFTADHLHNYANYHANANAPYGKHHRSDTAHHVIRSTNNNDNNNHVSDNSHQIYDLPLPPAPNCDCHGQLLPPATIVATPPPTVSNSIPTKASSMASSSSFSSIKSCEMSEYQAIDPLEHCKKQVNFSTTQSFISTKPKEKHREGAKCQPRPKIPQRHPNTKLSSAASRPSSNKQPSFIPVDQITDMPAPHQACATMDVLTKNNLHKPTSYPHHSIPSDNYLMTSCAMGTHAFSSVTDTVRLLQSNVSNEEHKLPASSTTHNLRPVPSSTTTVTGVNSTIPNDRTSHTKAFSKQTPLKIHCESNKSNENFELNLDSGTDECSQASPVVMVPSMRNPTQKPIFKESEGQRTKSQTVSYNQSAHVNNIQSMNLSQSILDVFQQFHILDTSQIPNYHTITDGLPNWKTQHLMRKNSNAARAFAEELRVWGSVPTWKREVIKRRQINHGSKSIDRGCPSQPRPTKVNSATSNNAEVSPELADILRKRLQKVTNV